MKTQVNPRGRLVVALLTVALAMAGCGAPGEGAAGSGNGGRGQDTPASGPPGRDSGTGDRAQSVWPRPGTEGVKPVEWDRIRPAEDGHSLLVQWWSGIEPCYVLDRVEVHVDHRVVVVTLFEGRERSKKDVACPEVAVLKETKVTLEEPVDGRRIFDGAKIATWDPGKCPVELSLKKCPLSVPPSSIERPR